jgi:phosphohistidine phosphatase
MTSRSIVLLRHGKSDRAADGEPDLTRPLAPRGSRNAAAVGRLLSLVDEIPDLVLCSPATRARQTADLAAEAGKWSCPLEVCDELYLSALDPVMELIRRQLDSVDSVMVVGHEPTSSDLIAELVGGGSHRMATAGLARVELDVARWRQVAAGSGRLSWLLPSRLLEAAAV